jgi:hypothetical protein
MNERINELWARAVDASVPETYTSLSWAQIEKIKLVFAQLIVQECAEWVKNTDSNPDIGEEDARALLEHFGVES